MSLPEKKFEIFVTRTYSVTDKFTVVADTECGAKQMAEELSGDKDYNGNLQLTDVEIDVYSEKEI